MSQLQTCIAIHCDSVGKCVNNGECDLSYLGFEGRWWTGRRSQDECADHARVGLRIGGTTSTAISVRLQQWVVMGGLHYDMGEM